MKTSSLCIQTNGSENCRKICRIWNRCLFLLIRSPQKVEVLIGSGRGCGPAHADSAIRHHVQVYLITTLTFTFFNYLSENARQA